MANVYVDNDLQLTLETNTNISGASTFQIKYIKPDDTAGTWTGSLNGTTQIRYSITDTELDTAGNWQLKAWVVSASGEVYQGDPVQLEVRSPWQGR